MAMDDAFGGLAGDGRQAAGRAVRKQPVQSPAARRIELRINANLEQLHLNIAKVESRCGTLADPENAAAALVGFKRLSPIFDEIVSFIAVIETHTAGLEDERRFEVEVQLALLRRRLLRLHLETVAPMLQMVADDRDPLPLGTRHVMARWLKYLDENESLLRSLPLDSSLVNSDCAMIAVLRQYGLMLADRAPDLIDFDSVPRPRRQEPMLELPAPARRAAPAPVKPAGESGIPVHLVLINQDGRYVVDGRGSATLSSEIRRLGLSGGLATAMNVPSSTLVMMLNGRDPIPSDKLTMAIEFLRKSFGPDRFEVLKN